VGPDNAASCACVGGRDSIGSDDGGRLADILISIRVGLVVSADEVITMKRQLWLPGSRI
jgi:hypothetical protein